MAYMVKIELPCEGCGLPTTRRVGKRKVPKCFDCALRAAAQNVRQQHEKSGPMYDRWREGMLRSLAPKSTIDSEDGSDDDGWVQLSMLD